MTEKEARGETDEYQHAAGRALAQRVSPAGRRSRRGRRKALRQISAERA